MMLHTNIKGTSVMTIQTIRSTARRVSIAVIGAVFVALSLWAPVHAQPTPEEITQLSIYGQYHQYVPGDGPLGVACAGGTERAISLRGSKGAGEAFNYLVDQGLTPPQAAGIVANLIVESNVDPLAVQPSGYGHGIAQWETIINGRGSGRWDKLPPVNGQPRSVKDYAASNAGRGRPMTDMSLQLDFLWYELNLYYKSVIDDIRKTTNEGDAAFIFMSRFEVPAERSPGGANDRNRRRIASEVLSTYGAGAIPGTGAVPTGSTGGCGNASGGVTSGSIVQTAIGLAWPQPFRDANPKQSGRTSALTPTPAYTAAINQYNAGNARANGGADCGVFVATVMKASGVDPDYPGIGTDNQEAYVRRNTGKYTLIENPTQADLQPGDILVTGRGSAIGHTWIYVGPQAGGYTSASASLDSRAPNLGRETPGGFLLARPK